jgi:mannose-6-phosphate isomerase-like protein (cupin superfamily)
MKSQSSCFTSSIEDALAVLSAPGGKRFASIFEHGSLLVEIYAPRGRDPQQRHTRDEVYVVASGSGEYVCEEKRLKFGVGDLLFAAAGVEHRFENFTNDLAVWVIFYGPEGGEAEGAN